MANDTPQTFTLEQVLELLNASGATNAKLTAEAIAAGMAANAPIKRKTYGQYRNEHLAGRPKLTRVCSENGFRLDPDRLTIQEIKHLNAITHTGRYINRIVEVIIHDEGTEESVEIRYNNSTVDQRMVAQRHFHSFEHLLEQVVTAQKAEDTEQQELELERKTRPVRNSFETKATREAREKAGV